MNKKKSEELKKRQYPLYLTAKQKEGLDEIYKVFLEEYDGDATYQSVLRNLLFKGAKYFKIKYGIIEDDKKEREANGVDLSSFDIDKIVGGEL